MIVKTDGQFAALVITLWKMPKQQQTSASLQTKWEYQNDDEAQLHND